MYLADFHSEYFHAFRLTPLPITHTTMSQLTLASCFQWIQSPHRSFKELLSPGLICPSKHLSAVLLLPALGHPAVCVACTRLASATWPLLAGHHAGASPWLPRLQGELAGPRPESPPTLSLGQGCPALWLLWVTLERELSWATHKIHER